MKKSLLCRFGYGVRIGAVLILQSMAFGSEGPSRVVTVAELNSKKIEIIGRLGLPLGTVAEIEATVVDGGALTHRPDLRLEFVLSVDRVNGMKLPASEFFSFRLFVFGERIIERHSDLPKLTRQTTSQKKPTEEELEEMKRSYVGTRFKLALFEMGTVGTFPRNRPEDVAIWSNWQDYFQTTVVVLAVR